VKKGETAESFGRGKSLGAYEKQNSRKKSVRWEENDKLRGGAFRTEKKKKSYITGEEREPPEMIKKPKLKHNEKQRY